MTTQSVPQDRDPAPTPPHHSGPPKQSGKRVLIFALTWVSYASYYLGRKGWSVTKSRLEEAFGLSREMLGTIDTGYLAAYAVGQFSAGAVGDRLGSRRLLGFGMLLVAAAVAGFGFSSIPIAFAGFFIINGFFQATGWPGNVKAMGAWFTARERGTIMGIWATCYQAGGLIGTAVATLLLTYFGWRWAFFGPAAWIALVGVLILAFMPERRRTADAELAEATGDPVAAAAAASGADATGDAAASPAPEHAMDEPADREAEQAGSAPDQRAEGYHPPRGHAWALLKSPVIWSLGSSYFCLKLIRYSILFWLPYYLYTVLDYSASQAGYLSISFEVGGIIGSIIVGYVSDRLFPGRRRPIAAIMVAALAGALLLYTYLAPIGAVMNFLGMALVGFCLFGPDTLISGAAAQDVGGEYDTAKAAGLINGLGSTGAVLQGWVTAGMSTAFGWDALFYTFVGLAIISSIALLIGRTPQGPSHARPQPTA